MLIITADDYGISRHSTDCIYKCFSGKRITSASAMVFMEDSERAASLSSQSIMEVGLHLNFTQPFNACNLSTKLREHQNRIIAYLAKHKLAQILYNPLLTDSFNYLFLSQQAEFMRLYGSSPDFYNGHHHMHLSANVLLSEMIPKGVRVRRTFTFDRGEKDLFNRIYRYILNRWVSRRFISTDSLFNIAPVRNHERIRNIFNRSGNEIVEIEVHPVKSEEIEFLFSDQYQHLINAVQIGMFRQLHAKKSLMHE